MAYCVHRLGEVSKIVQDCIERGERVPPHIKELNKNLASKKGMIEGGCQSGQITPQEYAKMLEMLMQKDQAILRYLAPMKDTSDAIY